MKNIEDEKYIEYNFDEFNDISKQHELAQTFKMAIKYVIQLDCSKKFTGQMVNNVINDNKFTNLYERYILLQSILFPDGNTYDKHIYFEILIILYKNEKN